VGNFENEKPGRDACDERNSLRSERPGNHILWLEWLLVAIMVLVGARDAVAKAPLLAGAARVDITPPIGHAMWGYAARHDRPSVGVLDRLQARALVLAVGTEHIAIVSLDLGRAPTRQSTAAIRTRTRKETGIEHVFLVASHTHHGPVIELDDWPTPENSYVRTLERKIAEVILEANRSVQPARLGVASKQVPFNRNRHSSRSGGPVDRELLVLRFENTAGKPIAHLVNFAAHAVLTDGKVLKFSADYPGALAEFVERESGAPCLFLQGAAGDLSPDPGGVHGPQAFGQLLGREVMALSRTLACTPELDASLKVAEDDFRFQSQIDHGNPLIKLLFVRAFFPQLVEFYVREYHDGIRPHLTTAVLDGRIGFVGVSGEFFCAHSLSLKRRSRLDALFFLGYCNDYQQYFPTIEASAEGGYGAEVQVAPVEIGAGERVMDRALIRLFEMRGKLAGLPPSK
jgi:hypothetical protein